MQAVLLELRLAGPKVLPIVLEKLDAARRAAAELDLLEALTIALQEGGGTSRE